MSTDDQALPQRKWLRHDIPDTINDPFPVFFLTICCQQRHTNQLATEAVWLDLLDTILTRNASGLWRSTLFLTMPDHIHGIFRFEGAKPMKQVITDWKRWTSRQLGITWQKGFFDHRLRSEGSATEKRLYILQNPVRANLVEHPNDWPFVYDEFANR